MNMIACPSASAPSNLSAAASFGSWLAPRLNCPGHEALVQQIVLNPAKAAAVYKPLDMATVLDLLYG